MRIYFVLSKSTSWGKLVRSLQNETKLILMLKLSLMMIFLGQVAKSVKVVNVTHGRTSLNHELDSMQRAGSSCKVRSQRRYAAVN
ncbi:Uncharacterized protein HZ326_20804 [Fusarium oxysporum f. sp. albedinis]|nr:Uncharacterized protein HZ326_20804 [Fusarium oxysporum f. sp. albedinis]